MSARTIRLHLCLTERERAEWGAAALEAGETLSVWIRGAARARLAADRRSVRAAP